MSVPGIQPSRLSRRRLLQLGFGSGLWALVGHRSWPALADVHRVIARENWASLVELADGIWAVASTPLSGNDWRTGCNGGLVAGKERVVAIEAFLRPDGAEWVSERTLQLTGRRPTDVVITHFHGDHVNGLEGYGSQPGPRIWMTRTTFDLVRDQDAQAEEPPSDERARLLEAVELLDEHRSVEWDLGGLALTLHPRRGHTPSDVSIEIGDPSMVFGGDLLWNGFFPNYRDTLASEFTAAIETLRRDRVTTYIPGHGNLATGQDVDTLLTLVESVEWAARNAYRKGVPVDEAAAAYRLPDTLSDWVLFNPRYFEVAFKAWYQELGA